MFCFKDLLTLNFELAAPFGDLSGGLEETAATELDPHEEHTGQHGNHRCYRHRQRKRPAEFELPGPPQALGKDDDIHWIVPRVLKKLARIKNVPQRGHPARAVSDLDPWGSGRKTDGFVLYILATPLS